MVCVFVLQLPPPPRPKGLPPSPPTNIRRKVYKRGVYNISSPRLMPKLRVTSQGPSKFVHFITHSTARLPLATISVTAAVVAPAATLIATLIAFSTALAAAVTVAAAAACACCCCLACACPCPSGLPAALLFLAPAAAAAAFPVLALAAWVRAALLLLPLLLKRCFLLSCHCWLEKTECFPL